MDMLGAWTRHKLAALGLFGLLCSCGGGSDILNPGDGRDGSITAADAASSDGQIAMDASMDAGCSAGCARSPLDSTCDLRCEDASLDGATSDTTDAAGDRPYCWKPLTTLNAPSARAGHVAVWSGETMLVWAGIPADFFPVSVGGGRYNPQTDVWQPTASAGKIPGRILPAGVWTGAELLVWGGHDPEYHTVREALGGLYNPTTDVWTPTTLQDVPLGRAHPAWAFSGEELLVWGGVTSQIDGNGFIDDGARYSPKENRWQTMSAQGAPSPRFSASGVWTGSLFIVWGGYGTPNAERSGAAYSPANDEWLPVSSDPRLPPMEGHSAVWTGSEMIVWNGSGAAYNPSSDTWRILSNQHGLVDRSSHSAIWTGTHMIIFGGRASDATSLNDGAMYDPASDSWSPLETCGAPAPRRMHSAVWTGRSMIIWGGWASSERVLSDGAIYVPPEFRSIGTPDAQD